MLRIGICDDEREVLESHTELVRHIMHKIGMNADVRKCHTGNELLMETKGIWILFRWLNQLF